MLALKTSLEVTKVRTQGQSVSDRLAALVYLPNQKDQIRVAVLASRSVGGAVQRNRCKRLLRSRMAKNANQLRAGFDVLIIARKPLLEADPIQVDHCVAGLLSRANLVL